MGLLQSCPDSLRPRGLSPPDSSVHGIFQASLGNLRHRFISFLNSFLSFFLFNKSSPKQSLALELLNDLPSSLFFGFGQATIDLGLIFS